MTVNGKKSELVTVLMPVYNSELYLSEAIESILNQTYTQFEFLIFDDGSTDDSPDIIRSYAIRDSRIKAFFSNKNKGYAVHLNKGIHLAQGKYVARMDSDDISLPMRLELQLAYLILNPSVVAIGSSSLRIDVNGTEHGLSKREGNSSYLFWQSFFTNPLSHPTVLFSKEVICNVGNYNPEKLPAEDYDLWTRVLFYGDIANIEQPLLKYREHENSISVKNRSIQLAHSSDSLKKHWQNWLQIDIDNEEVKFLKSFHKGYDDIGHKEAFILFWKIISLRKLTKKKYDSLFKTTELSFFNVSIYLISKVRKKFIFKAFIMLIALLATMPISIIKRVVYGRI